MKVAVLGTGTMGSGMARSMLRAGLDVTVWNRTISRAQTLEADGATVASTVQDAVRDVDAALTMVFDARAVLDIAGPLLGTLPGGATWIQSATIGLNGISHAGRLAGTAGVTLLDAPMLGTKQPAEEGTLVPLVSGSRDAARAMRPVFEAVGSKTVCAGGSIGQGTALKLACNAWIASITAALGQSLGMAAALGTQPNLFLEAIDGGQPDSPYAHLKGKEMLAGRYPVSFTVGGVTKDLGLMLDAALAADFPQILLRPLHELYSHAGAAGHSHDDIAAVYTEFDSGAGR